MWMFNDSSENDTDEAKFHMIKTAGYGQIFFFFSSTPFSGYIIVCLFDTAVTLHPQACYISVIYKSMTVS